MGRRSKQPDAVVPKATGPLRYPCDRCGEREGVRWGVATVVHGERGGRQQRVGLCDPCAAACAAPGSIQSSLGGVTHGFISNGRRG